MKRLAGLSSHPPSVLILFLAVSLCLLPSCKETAPKLRVDPTFTRDNLRAGGIGIGGIVSLVPGDADSLISSGRFEHLLQTAVKKKGNLSVLPSERMKEAMGDSEYEGFLEGYRLTGTIRPADLSGMGSSFCAASRYLIFARVEADAVLKSTGSHYVDGDKKDWFKTKRLAVVSFVVCDVKTGRNMCTGVLSGEEAHVRKFKGKEKDYSGLIDGAIANLFEGEEDPEKKNRVPHFREPPEFELALVPVITEFTNGLPLKK